MSRAARPRQSTVRRVSSLASCPVSKRTATPSAASRSCSCGRTRRGSTWPSSGKNSASRKRPSSAGSSSAMPLGVEPLVAAGHAREAVEVGAVARMRHDQRAVERRVGELLAPEIERAGAEPGDDRFRRFALAPRREHAAGDVAHRLRHGCVVALVDGDVEAGLRQRERLPRAGDAGADDVGGRNWARGEMGGRDIAYRLGPEASLSLRRHDPDQVQRVAAFAASQLRSEHPSERSNLCLRAGCQRTFHASAARSAPQNARFHGAYAASAVRSLPRRWWRAASLIRRD